MGGGLRGQAGSALLRLTAPLLPPHRTASAGAPHPKARGVEERFSSA